MATSSARYVDLYDYARMAEQMDYELMGQADRLINQLSYYEATCRESAIQVGSDGLGSALRSYASRALPIDQRVRTVGEGFQRADGQAATLLERLTGLRIGSILFRLRRPGRVLGATDERPPAGRTPMPGPKPVPTPTPPVKLYDGVQDRPNWLAERINRLREWIDQLFDRDGTQTQPAVTPTSIIINSQPLPEEESSEPAAGSEAGLPSATGIAIPKIPYGKLFEGGATKLTQEGHTNNEPPPNPPRGVAIDIGVADQSKIPTVHALVGGTVVKKGYDRTGYGNYIKILQDDGTVVLYAHLAELPGQNVGDPVSAGDKLAQMGTTGKSTGIHLHIEFREPKYDAKGNYITDTAEMPVKWGKGAFDPIEYLRQRGVAI